jgi:hypothetical protein
MPEVDPYVKHVDDQFNLEYFLIFVSSLIYVYILKKVLL